MSVRSLPRSRRHAEEEGESYYVSMSDLMAGVLFLFIIMLTYFALELRVTTDVVAGRRPSAAAMAAKRAAEQLADQKRREQAAAAAAASKKPAGPAPAAPLDDRVIAVNRIAGYLNAHGVQVHADPGSGLISFPNQAIFDANSPTVSASGHTALSALGEALQAVLPCYTAGAARPKDCPAATHHLGAVFVEGHDAAGTSALSQALSIQQATGAYLQLIQREPTLPNLQTESGRSLVSIGAAHDSAPGQLQVRLVMAADR
jgi:outer membrane protein OmpA-like peptidoglycan-associated protein